MRIGILSGFSALVLLGCDLFPPLEEPGFPGADSDTSGLGATSTSGGASADGGTLAADGDTLGATSLEPPWGSTSGGGSTSGDPIDETTTADPPIDLGSPPPVQSCHALPVPAGAGPQPVWCDEWIPAGFDEARGRRVAVGPAGEIYVTGKAMLPASESAYLARYDPDGVRQWALQLDHGPLGYDQAAGVAVAPGGDVLVGGQAVHGVIEEHGWIARFTPDGEPLWDLDQPDLSIAWRIEAAADGTFVVVGSEPYYGTYEPPQRITRHAADGSLLWLHGPHGVDELSENLAQAAAFDAAGNVYVVGSLSDRERLVSKLDPGGSAVWELRLPYDAFSFNHATDVVVSPAGDVFTTGYIDHGAWMARFTSDGAQVWDDVIAPGVDFDDYDFADALVQLPDGDLVLVGDRSTPGSNYDLWLRRYTPEGAVVWDYTVPAASLLGAYAEDVALTPEGEIVVVGTVHYGATSYLWLARFVP